MAEDNRTLVQLAQEVLEIQDGSVLSGLVYAWGRSIGRLRSIFERESTSFINRHPINVLWADKMSSLTGATSVSNFMAAHDKVEAIAKGVE